MGIMYNLYSYTFLAFKDYLNRRRLGKQVYQDVMEGRRAPAAYTHPEVAHLEPHRVNELSQMIREDLPKLKQDECCKYRAMDGNMIYLKKNGNVDVFDLSDKPVAVFYGVSFFEKYYDDDPRQSIDNMLFDGKTEPNTDRSYELEDGNSLLYNPSKEAEIAVYLPQKGGICSAFLNLECFFYYYKMLHETEKQQPQQPQQPQENMVKKYCTSCGAQLPHDTLFCGKCGVKQPMGDKRR
ncbi:MAG: zinc ribbon domain-containing protein [Nanoarchaeota archaeon]|nr:zinc ribbon domain-containing protein [Nanoarchaeota archaeon]